ncbi:phosphoglycerate kinase [Candidatus Azambacteria bacterium]|nr:phosphoglycerate kinase [Candidatus Azambacteria bacterium]
MIKSVKEVNFLGKRILMRVDFNVEFDNRGKILNTFRIDSLETTFDYILDNGGKLVLISHLGEPNGVDESFSLKRLGYYFDDHFKHYQFKFLGDVLDPDILEKIDQLQDGEIAFLENLRFHKEEKLNDENFAKQLASLGDFYVNEAFGVSHRLHASIVAITKFLPSYIGLLFDREMRILSESLFLDRKPLTVILGGKKISSKFHFIKYFLNIADHIILSGVLANTFFKARRLNIGDSFLDKNFIDPIEESLLYNKKIHLPIDVLVIKENNLLKVTEKLVEEIKDGEIIYDIGTKSIELFSKIINESHQIIWNGPMGFLEDSRFTNGSLGVAKAIVESSAYSIIAGGETAVSLHQFSLSDKISYISGGGATLEFLSGNKLPGIEALETSLK